MGESELEKKLEDVVELVVAGINIGGYDPNKQAEALAAGLMLFSHRRLTDATQGLVRAPRVLAAATAVLAVVTLVSVLRLW